MGRKVPLWVASGEDLCDFGEHLSVLAVLCWSMGEAHL